MSANAIEDIYQFEAQFEAAYAAALTAAALKVVVPGNMQFQKERPRVELEVNSVADMDNFDQQPTSDSWRNVGFRAQLIADCISNTAATESGDGNIGLHRAYVAQVRNVFAELYAALREANFHPLYVVNTFACTGTTQTSRSDQGYFTTVLTFDFNFTIRPDAWPQT